MDATNIHVAVNSLMECSICLQVYQDPRNLPCGHTFCLECLKSTQNPLCPLCKTPWAHPVNGLQNLPKNFIVANFITSLPSLTKCALTDSATHGPVKFFCVNCWDPLCEKCADGHTKYVKITKGHVIKNINDVDKSDVENHNRQKTTFCVKHKNQEMILYCSNCEDLSCTACYALSHNKHECISVEEAEANITNKMNESIKQLQDIMRLCNDELDKLLLHKNALETNKKKLLQTVTTLMTDTKQKIHNHYENLLTKVDDCFENVLKLINNETNKDIRKVDKIMEQKNMKLVSLEEKVSLLQSHLSPLSTLVERQKILKSNTSTKTINDEHTCYLYLL